MRLLMRLLVASPEAEGWEVDDNLDWTSVKSLWKKRFRRLKSSAKNAIYPLPPNLFWAIKGLVCSLHFGGVKVPLHGHIASRLPLREGRLLTPWLACVVLTVLTWLVVLLATRGLLRVLLSYKGWLNEERAKGTASLKTQFWFGGLKLLAAIRKPGVYSLQGVLPRLPVPPVKDTVEKYLQSMKPLEAANDYKRLEKLAEDFKRGIAPRLQRYLQLKSWRSSNYVTDWWEEYAYLRSRSPLMVNSNFYGFDCLRPSTKSQIARAATHIHVSLQFRRRIERQELEPILVQGMIPLCMAQLERLFNSSRVPGEEVDRIVHYKYSRHIVVLHKGRYFKVPVYHKNRLLRPSEIEIQLRRIVQDASVPQEGEERLAALTAGERSSWARARGEFFTHGVNRDSLKAVEKAALFVSLDDFPYEYHELQDSAKLEAYARALFHGKGCDRWFDKSFALCFGTDGAMGLNAEHSWADGAIVALYMEYLILDERLNFGYTADGQCLDRPELEPPAPTRLRWDLPTTALAAIDSSYKVAQSLIADVDLRVHIHREYGKGFIKTCKVSPDGFLQMALQLAYFRDMGKFGLTYETGTTRLFLEGRTETVRPCSLPSTAWVLAMQDSSIPVEEKVRLLKKACVEHQSKVREVMCGRGVDRHLFSLYIVSQYLKQESPFLQEVLGQPWVLSTSQTPIGQTPRADLKRYPETICGGGGFGPTAPHGYGVSYIIAGDDLLFFHVTSWRSSTLTDSQRFLEQILRALSDMRDLFTQWNKLQETS